MPSHTLLWIRDEFERPVIDGWLEGLSEFAVTESRTVPEPAQASSLEAFDCVLVSGKIAGMIAIEALEALQALNPVLPVIFWDNQMRATDAVRLVRAGAYQCIGERDSFDTLRDILMTAVEERRVHAKARRLAVHSEPWRRFLVGQSPAMEEVVETIRLVGSKRCTVLISGESGTGKEMAARALHLASPRAAQPFVAVNCTALPENLLEAELFGHVKGAFTGAAGLRIGRFEQANRGTLFLDEIGDMPIELQAKLLRVLQEREVQRLGSSESIRVDVRILAASNANLLERVQEKRFREDLYYRLNVVPLEMPPLRRRSQDIPSLVEHFVEKICHFEDIPLKQVSPEAVKRLQSADWPGNVRQLENAVEMAVAMSGSRNTLLPADFGLAGSLRPKVVVCELPAAAPLPERIDFDDAVYQFERNILNQALEKTAGNKTAAAEMLGLKRTTLIMKLRSFENARC
jgi:DNA-binding NtrC family response regulator